MRIHNFKHRKIHKVKVKHKLDYKRIGLIHGHIALRSLKSQRILDTQIESARATIKKKIKKSGIIWPMYHATQFITKKPGETRMGKGKGFYSQSIICVQKGTILFELGGKNLKKKLAIEALAQASVKLPIETEIIYFKS